MRIVAKLEKRPILDEAGTRIMNEKTKKPKEKEVETKTVKPGYEDLIVVLGIVIILLALWFNRITIDQALAYLGISSSGGVWGLLSGLSSDKPA